MKHNPKALSAFGSHLRALRERRGWSQQELADTAHLHKTTVQRAEWASFIVSLDILVSLARALEVPVEELVRIPGLEQMDKG